MKGNQLMTAQSKKMNRGFTLIELMVTVAVIAIIASIAFPAYQNMVLRASRSDAIDSLATIAQALERRFTETNSYSGYKAPEKSVNGYYKIELTTHTTTTYTIKATAIGRQAKDTQCAFFQIDNTGKKEATTAGSCW